MEFLIASGIGVLTASGVYLIMRGQTYPVIIGLAFVTYAVNLFLFAMGRLVVDQPPIIDPLEQVYADPLPQALVLTAIVISFGMTALIVVLALRGFLETGSDGVESNSLVDTGLPDTGLPEAGSDETREGVRS
jgi:multicomponent K+:H+ antiporter subunit C